MTLRKSLFWSIFISVLSGFLISSFVLFITQEKSKKIEVQSEISRLTELVCTTNVAYAWGYDTIGLQNSLEAMLKDPQIIAIEVNDYADNPMANVSEDVIGNIYNVEEIMEMDGLEVAKARIAFTDYYISRRYLKNLTSVLILEVILFFIVIIVVMITTGLIVKRPIENLTNVVKDMTHGEGDLTVRIPVTHHNELAVLSSYFNLFLDKLHVSITNLRNVGVASESLGENLDTNTKELSNSITDISQNMNEVNQRIGAMNNEMRSSESNVTRINDFIYSVADMIKEQSESVSRSSTAIEKMISNITNIENLTETKLSKVETLEKEAAKLEVEAKRNVDQMFSASESTKKIMKMVAVINNIATRTNLLAMNAAIEASHAGTAGKGFSVVAGEIRKLAEQTAQNSKNIEETITEIVEEIAEATKSSQDSSVILSKVLAEISDVATGLNDTLKGLKDVSIENIKIIESLDDLKSLTDSVTSSSEEMRRGTEEIKNSITKIMDITDESKKEIDDMTKGMNKVSNAMVDLTFLSKDNSSNIDALETEIRKFKV
ncbi:MAG: methyl-accepting chemotaxis protein [Treponema sp.]|nr:methyl-accepting chemotaxis protein [Treponema sp.]